MKKLIIFIIVISLGINLYSQERENKPLPVWGKVSELITNFQGWDYNEYTGQWGTFRNRIKHLQIAEFVYNNSSYYVFIVVRYETGYKYPHSKIGPYQYEVVDSYIFNSKEYNKLNNESGEINFIAKTMNGNLNKILLKLPIILDRYESGKNIFIQEALKNDDWDYQFSLEQLLVFKSDYSFKFITYKENIRFVFNEHKDFKNKYFEIKAEEFKKILVK